MSENENQSQESQEPMSPPEPERDIAPPEVTFVLDNYTPPIHKNNEILNESNKKDK